MQFGVFSVGDITPDPNTGRAVSEAERIRIMVTVALKAEEVGLDVFAIGEHHNPPFVSSSPTTLLAHIAALTERIILSTAVTLITTNDPVKIAEQAAYYGDGFFHNNIFWPADHVKRMVALYRRRWEHYGHGPADQAIVGLGGHVFMRKNSQDAVREFRPYFDHAPVYGGGMSLEDYMAQTPMTIGSPQQVIDRTLGFREFVGDYQRQLFIADHGGLPLKTVLEQMDILGGEVVPVLRREFAALKPVHVPEAPVHPRVVAARAEREGATADATSHVASAPSGVPA